MRRAVLVSNPNDDVIIGVELIPSAGHPVDVPMPLVRRPMIHTMIHPLLWHAVRFAHMLSVASQNAVLQRRSFIPYQRILSRLNA
jgi:hypothetical protein